MRKKRFIIFLTISFLVFVIVSCIVIVKMLNDVLPYSAIRPYRVSQSELIKLFPYSYSPEKLKLRYSPFTVITGDSIKLKAWFIYSPKENTKGTIVLLHGIASFKESLLRISKLLTENGFNCILFDSRAHGQSGGLNCTFGYYEKHDLSILLDTVINRFDNVGPLGIFGFSLGASVAIQTMEKDMRIKCGVFVSPFATLREAVNDYWQSMIKINIPVFQDYVSGKSELIAHYSVDSVKPEESAKHIKMPVMVIHGTEDKKIKFNYGERVFKNLASAKKFWYPVKGAAHDDIERIGGKDFNDRILNFFIKNIGLVNQKNLKK